VLIFFVRAATAQLLIAQAFIVSYLLAARMLRGQPVLLRWVGVVVCGATLATAGFHVLSALRAFRLLWALVSLTLLTAAVIHSPSERALLAASIGRDARFVHKVTRRFATSSYRYVVLAFTLAALPIIVRPLVLPPLGWDTLTYHAVKAAMWVQHAGALPMRAPGPWSYSAGMWAGGELFTSWAMLPFHGDLLAMEVDVVEWLALGLALLALTREMGIREPYSSAAVGFTLAIPTLRISVGSGYVEVVLLMMAVCGWALAARFLRGGPEAALHLAVAAAAIAAGIKITFLPLSALLLAIGLIHMLRRPAPLRDRVGHVAAAIAIFTLVLAPWMLAAYRETGLPFSPLPVEILGKRLGERVPEMEWYMGRPIAAGERSDLAVLVQALFEERMGPGLATMLAAAASAAAWPTLWRRNALACSLLLASVGTTFLEYFAPSLSVIRREFASSAVRFLLPALVAAVACSVGFCGRYPRAGRIYLLFLIAATFFQLLLYLPWGVSMTGAAAVATISCGASVVVVVIRYLGKSQSPAPWRITASVLSICIALLALQRLRDELRDQLFAREYMIHPIHRYWLDGLPFVDMPQNPRRIAVTSGPMQDLDNWLVYPFLGRRLQNEARYVPISGDGKIRHFGRASVNAEYAETADFATWMRRLHEDAITEVMSFRPASIELRWMESDPAQFHRLAGENGDWGLFALTRPPTP
jgi:hypothetical protein